MAYAQSFETALSIDELNVLGFLDRQWPVPATVTPRVGNDDDNRASDATGFVETVQTLNDNGLILYEAFPDRGIVRHPLYRCNDHRARQGGATPV